MEWISAKSAEIHSIQNFILIFLFDNAKMYIGGGYYD